MGSLCEKILMVLDEATEDDPRCDSQRLKDALAAEGLANAQISLAALRQLYPACREGKVTATIVYQGDSCRVTRIEPGDTTAHCYGLACDYGSTTIVMQLVDTSTGEVLAQQSKPNGQIAYGTDILTRITYGLDGEEHREDLRRVSVDTFNALVLALEKASGIPREEYSLLVVSGNSTMQHLLLGLDAWPVFSAPYSPVTLDAGFFDAEELGLDLTGQVYLIPGASNYVGGDIMSGLLTLDFYHHDEVGLFFDIGTNGELVMGNNEWLMGGAGAAGPALEGYISKFGMRAQAGAIDTVSIEGNQLTYTTIEGAAPCGICGSGIIDLLASMRLAGWVGIDGTLNPKATDRIVSVPKSDEETQLAVVYAPASQSAQGENLVFTQDDIRQYLETKAAAHTMVDCMMDAAGLSIDEIDHLYLTGAFPAHANLENAITIGMFPDVPRQRFTALRNASLDGARTLLMDASCLDMLAELRERIYCVQFASMPDFMYRMRAAKFIPHTNMEDYPTVTAALAERGLS